MVRCRGRLQTQLHQISHMFPCSRQQSVKSSAKENMPTPYHKLQMLMVGFGAAGKTTTPYQLDLVQAVATVPTSVSTLRWLHTRITALPFEAGWSTLLTAMTVVMLKMLEVATASIARHHSNEVWIPLVGLETRQHNDTSHTKQCARHLLQGTHVDTAYGYSHQKAVD